MENLKNLTSLTEWFFQNCPCPIIGITGTKGKGTTSTLIYEILKTADYDAYLGGNIGTPPTEFFKKLTPQSVVVLELSSFQIQTLQNSPNIAVILNITSDHLDYHEDIKEYREAKAELVKHQHPHEFIITNADYKTSRDVAKLSNGVHLSVSTQKNVKSGVQIEGQKIVLKNDGQTIEIMKMKDVGLIGKHNFENILPAVMAATLMDVTPANIKKAVKAFKGLPHRLELVATRKGVKYYNDSFSTTPETSIAGIQAFNSPTILIAGGSEKKSNFKQWAKACMEQKSLKAIILTGKDSADRMEKELNKALKNSKRRLKISRVLLLEDAMKEAKTMTKKDWIVLMSPACASFEEFENYKKRGEVFATLAKK